MLRNLKDRALVAQVMAPATLAASVLSSATNLQGKRNHAYSISVGAFAFDGSNYLTYTIHESDDNSSYAENTASGSLVLNLQASHENKTHMLEYKGTKQYVKLNIAETGTVSVTHAVNALSTELEKQPSA